MSILTLIGRTCVGFRFRCCEYFSFLCWIDSIAIERNSGHRVTLSNKRSRGLAHGPGTIGRSNCYWKPTSGTFLVCHGGLDSPSVLSSFVSHRSRRHQTSYQRKQQHFLLPLFLAALQFAYRQYGRLCPLDLCLLTYGRLNDMIAAQKLLHFLVNASADSPTLRASSLRRFFCYTDKTVLRLRHSSTDIWLYIPTSPVGKSASLDRSVEWFFFHRHCRCT